MSSGIAIILSRNQPYMFNTANPRIPTMAATHEPWPKLPTALLIPAVDNELVFAAPAALVVTVVFGALPPVSEVPFQLFTNGVKLAKMLLS